MNISGRSENDSKSNIIKHPSVDTDYRAAHPPSSLQSDDSGIPPSLGMEGEPFSAQRTESSLNSRVSELMARFSEPTPSPTLTKDNSSLSTLDQRSLESVTTSSINLDQTNSTVSNLDLESTLINLDTASAPGSSESTPTPPVNQDEARRSSQPTTSNPSAPSLVLDKLHSREVTKPKIVREEKAMDSITSPRLSLQSKKANLASVPEKTLSTARPVTKRAVCSSPRNAKVDRWSSLHNSSLISQDEDPYEYSESELDYLRAECELISKTELRNEPNLPKHLVSLLSPSRLTPLDNSFTRIPEERKTVSLLNVAELLCSMMSLVMNSETFLFFPLFLLEWRGAGLIVYLILLFLVAFPVFIMQTIIGSLEKSSSMVVWSCLVPVMSGLGPALNSASLFLVAKTCALMSYCAVYMMSSVTSPLPWTECEDWWGPDGRCLATSSLPHQSWNQSLLCGLSAQSGGACHSHLQPSHVQFWEKYVLQSDHHGLRVLGELGSPSYRLISISAAIWVGVGSLLVVCQRQILRVAGLNSIVLLALVLLVSIRNIVQEDVLSTVKIILSFSEVPSFSRPECWLEAFYLVITGISLFAGNISTYSSIAEGSRSIKLISAAALLFHVWYLVLASLTVLPLLPTGLNTTELRLEKEAGFFPLALLSLNLAEMVEGRYIYITVYLAIFISGFNLILGFAVNLFSVCSNIKSRVGNVLSGLLLAGLGLLLTVPLVCKAGPSLISLFSRFGFHLPVLVLGNLASCSAFWLYGFKRLSLRTKGNIVSSFILRSLWFINPILIFILVATEVVVWPPLPEPSPLPAWGLQLGMFLSACSLVQVVVGLLVSTISWVSAGYPAQLLGRAGHRSRGELRECGSTEMSTYVCYSDIQT